MLKSLDWRRGGVRLLIVLAVVYWLAASYWSFFMFYDQTGSNAVWERAMSDAIDRHDDAAFNHAFTERRHEWIMTGWLGMGLSAGLFVFVILVGLVVRWVIRGFTPRPASQTSSNYDRP